MGDSDLKVLLFFLCIYKFDIILYNLFNLHILMQKYLADILSVLALTMSAEGERVCRRYRISVSYILLC